MIVSVLRFDLKAGALPALGEAFTRHQILETAIQVEGCHTLLLASPPDETDTAYVLGLWQDEVAYERWIDHPSRSVASDDLTRLVAGDFDATAPAQLWRVLHSVHDAADAPNATS